MRKKLTEENFNLIKKLAPVLKIREVAQICGYSSSTIHTVKRLTRFEEYEAYRTQQLELLHQRKMKQQIKQRAEVQARELIQAIGNNFGTTALPVDVPDTSASSEVIEEKTHIGNFVTIVQSIDTRLKAIEELLKDKKEKKPWRPLGL